jgi:uncharacterized protein (TIGR00730 family)
MAADADGGFASRAADVPLRVTCYGSSSSLTPDRYLRDARDVGYLLAARGHVCVNGAGSYGCMAALNDGAASGNGHIVGVIHEMWLAEGEDSSDSNNKNNTNNAKRSLRDGGAHAVFSSSLSRSNSSSQHGGPHPAITNHSSSNSNTNNNNRQGAPIREMLVARGKDLQERKRLLVENSDALVVLPGGPGTWDELWEMACARNIGLTDMPIVCVNTCGYYDSFRSMLERAHQDRLTKLCPDDVLHFEDTPEGAIRWIERSCGSKRQRDGGGGESLSPGSARKLSPSQRAKVLRSSSVLSAPSISWLASTFRRASSWISEPKAASDEKVEDDDDEFDWSPTRGLSYVLPIAIWFGAGVAFGLALASSSSPYRDRR